MASTALKNTDIYLNALERTLQYKGVQKTLTDSFWETNISPILYPLWDSAKDKLEMFVYRQDGSYLIQRNKYKKNFKTNTNTWVAYEFDPSGVAEYNVTDLRDKLIDQFVEFRDVEENTYEQAIQKEYARSNSLTWDKIKVVRRFLLQDSDFTQQTDAPLTDEMKAMWKEYRAYIRDIPAIQNAETPFDVVFPITPDEYVQRKSVTVDQRVVDMIGLQGTDKDYLTSSYHFWKMNSSTLSSFAQRMTLYIAARTSVIQPVGNTDEQRVMVSPFVKTLGNNIEWVRERAAEIKANNDSANRDYIEELLDKIEKGEL
tara:strand:+ start:3406 stop:4350 length:945 start_codon:yes stop_codon:yes gene_type:complete